MANSAMSNHRFMITTITSLYRSEEYLEAFLQNCMEQTVFDITCFSLNVSAPSKTEVSILKKYRKRFGNHLSITTHNSRIPIYRAWNEMCKRATTPNIAIWNVDDVRTPDSLESQLMLIDDGYPSVAGPFMIVDRFGSQEGKRIDQTHASSEDWQEGMLHGPFFMFKRSCLKTLKGFDEQYKVAADFDFALRLSSLGEVGYSKNILGFYLNARSGMSTSKASPLQFERDSIYLRYGIIKKIDLTLLHGSTKYDLSNIYIFNRKYSYLKCGINLERIRTNQHNCIQLRWWVKHVTTRYLKFLIRTLNHYLKHPKSTLHLLLRSKRDGNET